MIENNEIMQSSDITTKQTSDELPLHLMSGQWKPSGHA
jgi:hypothetical protein